MATAGLTDPTNAFGYFGGYEPMGRQEAHDVIYDVAQAVARGELDGGFESGLMKDDKVRGTLDETAIKQMMDPARYTGLCAEMAHQQAERAREVAAGLC